MSTSRFRDIRPYEDAEVPEVIERLLGDESFIDLIAKMVSPGLRKAAPWLVRLFVRRMLRKQIGNVASVDDFQGVVSRYATRLIRATTTAFDYSGLDRLDPARACLFVSNHRDIATDSMLVNYALFFSGRPTVRIAVGDNLIQRQFATDLMRLNKSFLIRRSVEGVKKAYAALLESSSYIQQSLDDGYSIWIAQSEGRAKDGIDRTDPAVIKMFLLARRKEGRSVGELTASMNMVPVTLSYEYDPCDLLKANELWHVAREGSYAKPAGEDLISLAKGLGEFKGRVMLRFGTPLGARFETPEQVAQELDRQILANYELYPSNYVALSMIGEEPYASLSRSLCAEYEKVVTSGKEREFRARIELCPPEHRDYFLRMYANPLLNIRRASTLA